MSGAPDLEPVPSRRSPNAAMTARGLRSAAELAQGKPCGTRARYFGGCRCAACRDANRAYERERVAARERGETNRLVSAERARAHLRWLSSRGVGRKTAADAAKVAAAGVSLILDGKRLQIREQTERRILAVTEGAAADHALIDGTETLRLIAELVASGYSKARLASEILGRPARCLQIRTERVHARTAERVRRVYERLRGTPAGPTLERLKELSEEGFHRNRVARMLDEMAARRGWAAPDMTVQREQITLRTAELVEELHRRLIEDEAAP